MLQSDYILFKNSDFLCILHFLGRKASKVHACVQNHNSMVMHLWGKGGNREFSVKSWSHQALNWKGPTDTSLILTLSCRPLIYRGKEEAAEGGTFTAGSILTPVARTSHTTDQQPVGSVGSKATQRSQDFIRYSEHAWHCNRIQI